MQRGRPKAPRGLTAVLISAFLVLSILVLLATSISQVLFRIQEVRGSLEETQQLIAKDAANTVRSFVQEKFGKLEAVVAIGKPFSASPEQQKNVLGNLLGLEPAFRQLVLLDPQGRELSIASRLTQAASDQLLGRVGSDLFAQVRQGNRYVSPVYVDDITSEPLVLIAVQATDALGDFQGVLLAEVNLKFMWDLVERLQVGETGQAYVVDKQGNLIAHRDIAHVLRGENASQVELVAEFMHHPVPVGKAATGTVRSLDGSTVVGAYAPLGVPDWAVVTELPMAEALQSLVRSVVIGAVILVAVVALDLWLAVYLARRLAAPILSLTDTATRIAEGEMSLQAEARGPVEVVRLATAFNVMTAQLRELIGTLEQRVAERTVALERRAVQLATAADVGRAAASILEMNTLTRQVVELVRERFDLYYAALFLLDEAGEYAILEAGTGEPGRIMKERGHRLEVGGKSMVGAACAQRQARIALDVGAEAVRFDNPLLPETRSEMALPLMVGDRVLGALDVQSVREAAFSEEDIAVLQLVADQVAVAIDNARKFSAEAALLEATSPLYRLSRRLATATDTEEIARAIVVSVAETDADGCTVARFDFGSDGQVQTVTFLESWGRDRVPSFPLGRPLPLGDGDLSALTTFWSSEDVDQDPQLPASFRRFLGARKIRALANIPLRAGEQVSGFLIVFRTTPGPFSAVDTRLYETLADQSAVALERARLLEEAQHRAERERAIRDLTDQVTASFDLDTILQTTLQDLGRLVGAEGGYVELGMTGTSR